MTEPASAHIEQAKSGRAKCRRCREAIGKGELRLGELVDNPYGEGQASLWYHLRCAAIKRPQALLAALEAGAQDVDNAADLQALAEASAAHPTLSSLASIEQAPSGRARCQHCHELIEKGTLRVSRYNEADLMGIPTTSYIHLACVSAYCAAKDSAAQGAQDSAAEPDAVAPSAAAGDASATPASHDPGALRGALRLHLISHAENISNEQRAPVLATLDQLYPPTP